MMAHLRFFRCVYTLDFLDSGLLLVGLGSGFLELYLRLCRKPRF